MKINYNIVKNKNQNQNQNFYNSNSNTTDPFLKLISNLRNQIKKQVETPLKNSIGKNAGVFEHNVNIVSDVLVYTILKTSPSHDVRTLRSHPIFTNILNGNNKVFFCETITKKRITFQNVSEVVNSKLKINPGPLKNIENIINHPKLKDKPDIRTAIQMYLLKGHFTWAMDVNSEFKNFIYDKNQHKLKDSAKLNCWEALLYGMLQSKVVSRKALQDIYVGSGTDIQHNLTKWFNFRNSKTISDDGEVALSWKKDLSSDSYLIMMGKKHGWGLKHDMLSFPFSQKQILKMMITENFNEMPKKPKLFSNWTIWTDRRLDVVKKTQFLEELTEPDKDVRIASLKSICKRSKDIKPREM